MAIQKKKAKESFNYEVKVESPKEFDWGISFNLMVNGVMIYGCIYRGTDNGGFVSFPSKKGADGKYYSHAWFKITPEILENIEKQISDLLD